METSIYAANDEQGRGHRRALVEEVIARCQAMGLR